MKISLLIILFMKKVFLTRMKYLNQYDADKKIIEWEDSKDSRWNSVYNKLQPNDYGLFILGEDKILIGKIESMTKPTVVCTEVVEIQCSNDQLLQLHEMYPELITSVKANFNTFVHPKEININQLIIDANNQNYIGYYLVATQNKYEEIKNTLHQNDRIVLFNENKEIEDVKVYSNGNLTEFDLDFNIKISVEGITLEDILRLNIMAKFGNPRSNNIRRIEKIISEINTSEFYKFDTFFSYHDALYNNRLYNNSTFSISNQIQIKELASNEKIAKVAMSDKLSKEHFNDFLNKNLAVVNKYTASKGTSNTTQGETFTALLNIGDYIYICRGNEYLPIIGRITGETEPCYNKDLANEGWVQRAYETVATVIKKGGYKEESKWWTPNNNSTCIIIPKEELDLANEKIFLPFFKTKFNYSNTNNLTKNTTTQAPNSNEINPPKDLGIPKNQILFGPPGTGKTYHTINKALSIVDPTFKTDDRKILKNKFEEYVNSGQIVFTTFHQSMSYEDFVEGIKPETEKGKVTYEVQDGIFKQICQAAETPNQNDFNIAYDKLSEALSKLEDEKLELKTPTDKRFWIALNSNENLNLYTKTEDNKQGSLTKEKLQQQINGEKIFRGWEGYFQGVIDYLKSEYNYSEKAKKSENFVLIIDEINRGNVSSIFGELITLLEEDKRLGKAEVLKVKLPYSKTKFGVPQNLYIIGTMNTADRSVEALDSALRRRFSFTEMPPKPEIIKKNESLKKEEFKDIDLVEILTTINKRVEILLDKDHLIGHSYFMQIANLEDLKKAFAEKVIPLLQEYFYGDYGKIALILGEGFCKAKEQEKVESLFAKVNNYDVDSYSDKVIYEIKDVLSEDFDIEKAINLLLNKAV